MAKNSSRRASRGRAFQILYGFNYNLPQNERELKHAFFAGPASEDEPVPAKEPPADPELGFTPVPQPEGFVWELVYGVWSRQKDLDEVIERFSKHWKINRIAKIELTILRLALYEMLLREDIPVKVAINESIELAKQYGDDNSRAFINGILDAAAKALKNDEIRLH